MTETLTTDTGNKPISREARAKLLGAISQFGEAQFLDRREEVDPGREPNELDIAAARAYRFRALAQHQDPENAEALATAQRAAEQAANAYTKLLANATPQELADQERIEQLVRNAREAKRAQNK
jgi:tRNA(Ile)-lysidine synthase TilS/MesJ